MPSNRCYFSYLVAVRTNSSTEGHATMKKKKFLRGDPCRCNYWISCGQKNCCHHEPHYFKVDDLLCNASICRETGRLVMCLPLKDTIYEEEKDPNSVWRARKEVQGWLTPGRQTHHNNEEEDDQESIQESE
jgi:hypothetical protein